MNALRMILVLCCCCCAVLQAAEPTDPPGSEVVYLPYEKLPPADGEGSVLLPYERFLELWERAHREQERPDAPFAAAAFAPVEMRGELRGDVLRIELGGELRATGERWQSLPMPADLHLDAFAIERLEGSADEQPVLQRVGASLQLHLPGKGRWRWQAGMSLPVERDDSGRSQVRIVLPPAAVIRYRMPLPAEGMVLDSTPAVAATLADAGGGKEWQALLLRTKRVNCICL